MFQKENGRENPGQQLDFRFNTIKFSCFVFAKQNVDYLHIFGVVCRKTKADMMLCFEY